MLDENGVQRLTAMLHPRRGDCQSCVRPLHGQPISLLVDVIADGFAIAALHHSACQQPGWNDSGITVLREGTATYALGHMTLEFGDQRPIVLLILNPMLEIVFLDRMSGRWCPTVPAPYLRRGMRPQHPKKRTPVLDAVTVRLHPGGVAQIVVSETMKFPPDDDLFAADPQIAALLARWGSALLAVTHLVDPQEVASREAVRAMLADPATVTGIVRAVPTETAP